MNQTHSSPPLWAEIALDRHGVIEAHAGTGKTYTIVRMVLRMLSQNMPHGRYGRPDLRQILLVTYTEKAAGELRERIRAGLEESIRAFPSSGDATLRWHLQNNLDNIEEAWIGTIHSICQRILRTYPFESGLPFLTEMQDDRRGTQQALREVMRKEWSTDPLLDQALQLLAQEGHAFSEKQLAVISECAAILADPSAQLAGHNSAWRLQLELLYTQACELRQQQADMLDDFFQTLRDFRDAYQSMGNLNHHAGKNLLNEAQLQGWEQRMARIDNALFFRIAEPELGKPQYAGNSVLLTATQKKSPALEELDQQRAKVEAHPYYKIQKTLQENLSRLKSLLAGRTAPLVAELWQEQKQRQGFLSFNDLLSVTHVSVHQSAALRQALRSQFCYTLIDEFQDTSLLQWNIFRKIFIGDAEDIPDPVSSLFLVGDPKQSIYSFQGANVDTYLEARDTIRTLGSQYSLQVNFRSLPEMIAACNQVVEGDAWWKNKSLHYEQAQFARAPQRPEPEVIPADALPEKWLQRPLRAVSVRGKSALQKFRWARFIAQSIRGLHGHQVLLPDGERWKSLRPLHYGDFAVLTETNKEANRLVEALNQAGVPASKYKQEGIFQSEMARQVRIWCEAILNWENDASLLGKVLVTSLGNQTPQEVALSMESGADAAVERVANLLRHWSSLAAARRWARLTHSLLTDSLVETSLLQLVDGDRQISDLRQVLEYAHAFLDAGGRDLSDLVEHLRDLAEKRLDVSRDGNLHQKESDLQAVQVMTMHACKGLQFPVVYLVTRKPPAQRTPRVIRWVENGPGGSALRCYPYLESAQDSAQCKDGKELAQSQEEQEKQRLYYVAMTRAQLLLFVPLNESPNTKGEYKPNDSLSARLLECLHTDSTYIGRHSEEDHLTELPQTRSWSVQDTLRDLAVSVDDNAIRSHVRSKWQALHLAARSRRQESYTSLTHATTANARDVDAAQEPFAAEMTLPEPVSPQPDTLPKGKQLGIAWHAILEYLLKESELHALPDPEAIYEDLPFRFRDVVDTELQRNGVLTEARRLGQEEALVRETTWRICARAVKSPLNWKDHDQIRQLRLCDLPSTSRLAEVEFHLRSQEENLLGFMDLVFRLPLSSSSAAHPFRYFVLDWKSNHLEQYSLQAISANVHENRYDDQARLYCHALDQWLQSRLGSDYNPEVHLGGALYIYLRGMHSSAASTPLWFHSAAPTADAARVQALLQELQTQRQGETP